MAKRVRDFYRVHLSASMANKLREHLVDIIMQEHYRNDKSYGRYSNILNGHRTGRCVCVNSGALDVARHLESKLVIGKRRARFDVPRDKELVETITNVFRVVHVRDGWLTKFLISTAHDLEVWINQSSLERLAALVD